MKEKAKVTTHYDLIALVDSLKLRSGDAVLVVLRAQENDLAFRVYSIANEGRRPEPQFVHAVERHNDPSIEPEQSITDDEDQPALHHALAKLTRLRKFGVCVDIKPVSGHGTKVHDVGFCDGAAARARTLTNRELIEG